MMMQQREGTKKGKGNPTMMVVGQAMESKD